MEICKENIRQEIISLLKDADLETVSRKSIRLQLEQKLACSLSSYKSYINDTILESIQNTSKKKQKATQKRKSPFDVELLLSPELSHFMKKDRMARPQIVKELWTYIRENNLQNPKDKRQILFDDKLQKLFHRKEATMFSINKYLKYHVRNIKDMPKNGWESIIRDGISSGDEEKERKVKGKKKKRVALEDGESVKTNRANPLNAELALSPELANVLGHDRLSRPTIVKLLWKYIREHQLQDEKDKRRIVLDDTLKDVFQRDSFTMFSMNKYLKRHVRKPEQLLERGWESIPRDGNYSDEDSGK